MRNPTTRRKEVIPTEQICVAFDSASRFARSWGKPKNQCDIIPQRFLTTIAKDLNGYYGSSYKEGACGGNPSQDIWYSFKIKQIDTSKMPYSFEYRWQQITTLVRYNEAGKGISIFCLGCPPDIEKLVQEKLASHSISDPIEWHIILIEAIVELYDKSVWALRDYVRDAEFARDSSDSFQPNFVHLHETARHIVHSNETLDVAIDTIGSIRYHQKVFSAVNSQNQEGHSQLLIQDKLYSLQKELKCIKRRSESLGERLRNEIKLAFNLVAQRDSRILVQMGEDSKKDSNNMRSIAVVGLVYLPGTFVSGLFGMNFFQFSGDSGPQTWVVSEKLWLYWAVTAPLTLLTVIVWFAAFHGDAAKNRVRAWWKRCHVCTRGRRAWWKQKVCSMSEGVV